MRDDALRELLQASYPPQPPARPAPEARELAGILQRRRRRRHRARWITGCALVILMGLALWPGGPAPLATLVRLQPKASSQPSQARTAPEAPSAPEAAPSPTSEAAPSPTSPAVSPASPATDPPTAESLEELRQRIAVQRQVVDGLVAAKRLDEARQELERQAAPSAKAAAELSRRSAQHRVAALTLLHAQWLQRHPERQAEALAEYTWVDRHFAGTTWSRRARQAMHAPPGPL